MAQSTPRLLAALALSITSLIGCGDGPDPDGIAEPAPAVERPAEPAPPPPPWREEEVQIASGVVITSLLQDQGLDYGEALAVVRSAQDIHDLARIRAGETLIIRKDTDDDSFKGLVYPLDRFEERRLVVVREDAGGFSAQEEARAVERIATAVAGQVDGSLWATCIGMGLSPENLMGLAGIFEWEIDFNTQIRPGDRFRMVIEDIRDAQTGEHLRFDTILAAEYETHTGASFVGIRYQDSEEQVGYFDAEGLAARKMFLKSPLKFSRVSSRFGKRYHPVLKTWRAHKGTDYAAGAGTPIRAIGRGTISFRGTKGGYGRHVRVKHNGKYASSYSHLSRYAVSSGEVVEQGEVIGYVGSSGLATGPHLHFEFYVNGRQTDFLRQQFPRSEPIAEAERADFDATRDSILPVLTAIPWPAPTVAEAEPEPDWNLE